MKLLTKLKKVLLFIMKQHKKIIRTVFHEHFYDRKNPILIVILIYFLNTSTINRSSYSYQTVSKIEFINLFLGLSIKR